VPNPLKNSKNIKQVHGIIDPRALKLLSQVPGIDRIIPGMINWRKKTSAVSAGLYYQRTIATGIKMAIKKNMYVQDVYVIADLKKINWLKLKAAVENPNKVDPTVL
jgi:hypothetical protein